MDFWMGSLVDSLGGFLGKNMHGVSSWVEFVGGFLQLIVIGTFSGEDGSPDFHQKIAQSIREFPLAKREVRKPNLRPSGTPLRINFQRPLQTLSIKSNVEPFLGTPFKETPGQPWVCTDKLLHGVVGVIETTTVISNVFVFFMFCIIIILRVLRLPPYLATPCIPVSAK